METTRAGNIKIKINPDRHYQGQFVGYEYYSISDINRAFPGVDVASFDLDSYDDLGLGNSNADMIRHHCSPFRRVGYIVE